MFINQKHEEAYLLLESKDYRQAVIRYSECLSEFPESAVLFSERGVAFLHLNEAQHCLADLDRSILLEPFNSYRYASRGHARDFLGDIDGAIVDYEKAAELDPNDPIVYNNLGLLLEKKGRMKEAQDKYDRSDKLRKAEDKLYDVIDQIEGQEQNKVKASEESPKEVKKNVFSEILKIFTQKQQGKDFIQFIKNGFRLK